MTLAARLISTLCLSVAAACGPPAASGDDALDLTVAEVEVRTPDDGPLQFSSAIALRSQDGRFGGLSGFVLDDDGSAFVAVSDAGYWAVGRLTRTDGRLTGARITRYERFRGPDGATMARVRRDAEAIARHPDGGYLVAFERAHRVSRFADVGAPEGVAYRAVEWSQMSINAGVESLAAAPGGPVYAIKEGRLPDKNGSPVWIVGGSERMAARLPLWYHDYVTDADFDSDGRLYVLERRFSLFEGFTVNIQRFPRMPSSEADLVEPEMLLELTGANGVDNMEGLQIWRDPEGRTRLTLISDDNFNPLQRTLAIEFILRE